MPPWHPTAAPSASPGTSPPCLSAVLVVVPVVFLALRAGYYSGRGADGCTVPSLPGPGNRRVIGRCGARCQSDDIWEALSTSPLPDDRTEKKPARRQIKPRGYPPSGRQWQEAPRPARVCSLLQRGSRGCSGRKSVDDPYGNVAIRVVMQTSGLCRVVVVPPSKRSSSALGGAVRFT